MKKLFPVVVVIVAATAGVSAATAAESCGQAMLVIDRSASQGSYIGPAGGKMQKFGILVSAVKAFTAAQDKNIRFGFTYYPGLEPKGPYPDSYGEKEWCIPGKVVFDPKSGAAAEIATFLDMTEPAGQTPTWETLEQLVDYPPLKESRFKSHIVLITDGIPNCMDDMETGARSIAVIKKLADSGIPVFVVGFGVAGIKAVNTAILDKMAEAGGMPRPPPSPFKFYSASTPSEIADALDDIGGKVSGATVGGCVSGGSKDGGAGGSGGSGGSGSGGSGSGGSKDGGAAGAGGGAGPGGGGGQGGAGETDGGNGAHGAPGCACALARPGPVLPLPALVLGGLVLASRRMRRR